MSSKTATFTPTPKSTRGTFMAVDGKRVYIQTYSLEYCLINFRPDELSQQMRERLQSVFSVSISANTNNAANTANTDNTANTANTDNNNNKTYISIAFDYDYENPNNTEEYKFAGFWNPNTQRYEFDDKQLVNLISKM